MPEAEANKLRAYLDSWVGEGDAATIANDHPDCACENASPSPSGFGQISDDETLRYFVTSRSDIDLKRAPKKGITSAIFNRIFKRGVSTARASKADRTELELTAALLHENQVQQCGEYGGIMGIVDFAAGAVRFPHPTKERTCCALETPLEERPAHADLVASQGAPEPEVQKAIKLLLFNAIGGASAYRPVDAVTDCDLMPYLPEKLKS